MSAASGENERLARVEVGQRWANVFARESLKGAAIEDLKKARWYLDREISNRERTPGTAGTRGTP